jgi:hypothetical protein
MNWEMFGIIGRIGVILAPFLGAYFVFYGITNGFLKQKILSRHPDTYAVSRQAVILGMIFVALGVFLIVSSLAGIMHMFQ